MTNPGLGAFALACIIVSPLNAWQPVPPRQTAPPMVQPGSGVIAGVLTTADKGTPVRKATVP